MNYQGSFGIAIVFVNNVSIVPTLDGHYTHVQ